MPVSLAVGDIASFRKYVKDIGRAYQKRSVAMIQLSRLFLEISPGKPDQIDALRSLFETVESALKSAVDAGKERSEAADTAFATAEEELDWYAAWHHPEEQSVLGDVQNIIEDAAQKDSRIMKTHKRLSTRLGLNKTGSPPSRSLVKVHFQILKSPTDRREAPVVTCELGPDVKISELLWTLSRLPEDQRISLKQNPHFYFSRDLSDQASTYDDQFKLEPLQDLRPEKDSVVLVLLDRAGQIFVDYEKFSKTYGNIWKPHDAIILKDLQGTLEAADRISPRVTGEVCIWQRGGGRPEEDLSKWTEVLDRALDFPDVDWLIRSETSPDEAFDIEVTGGWERCSPVPTPDPPRLFGPDNDTITVPLLEGPHVSPGEVPSLVSLESSFVPTVGTTGPQPSYPSLDTVRSDVTADLSSKEVQSDDENHRSPVEDKGSFTLNVPSSFEITPEAEAVVHSPVHPTSISPGSSSTTDVESQSTLAHSASPPERPALPTAKESGCPQDEEAPTRTLSAPASTSSESPILPPHHIEPPPNSSVRPTLGNTPDDIHPRTQASQPPDQVARVLTEPSTSLARSPLALASTAGTPDNIPESAPPQIEVIHTTAHLGGSASEPLTPPFGCTPVPTTVAPTRSRATSSNDTVLQVEANHSPNAPEPPKPPTPGSSSPTLEHIAHAPDSTPVGTEIGHPTAARPIVRHISPIGSQQSLMGSTPAPLRLPLAVRPPPAAPAEPSLLMGKNASPAGGTPNPRVSPSPSERLHSQVEASHSPIQQPRTPSKPRETSSSIPLYGTPNSSRAHTQVEAPRPPVRAAPPDPRTPSFGEKILPINTISVPDVKMDLSSRPKIKSHPRRMVTPSGQRRSTTLSTQVNPQTTVPSSGQPMIQSVEQSAAGVTRSYDNATSHTSIVEPSNPSAENRGRYHQSFAAGLTPPLAQVGIVSSTPAAKSAPGMSQRPTGPSRRSTALAGQMVPNVSSLDKPAPCPVEKPAHNSALNRSGFAPISRDRTPEAPFYSFQAKSSSLPAIPAARGTPKGPYGVRSATRTMVAATAEKIDTAITHSPSALPNYAPRTSSIVPVNDLAGSPRKSMVSSEQMTSHPTVWSLYQPVIKLQPIISLVPNNSSVSDHVTVARPGKAAETYFSNSRTNISFVAGATETRGGFNGRSSGPRTKSAVSGAIATPPLSTRNSTSTSARIKTKDLISRHKQKSASDARPSSTTESASPSRASNLHISQSPVKLSANRVDSGIELWDYDHHGVNPDRRRGPDTSNGHSNPSRGRGPSSTLPTSSPVGASNTNNGLSLKMSRASMRSSHSPIISMARSGTPTSTLPLEQVQTPLLSATGSSSNASLASALPGRREPFINRKPQPTSHSGASGGFSTPPRSSTPSSMSRSASITTSTQATMVTPATSFTIPSRGSSPASETVNRSWFRRNVIDPFKSKLGYGS